MSFNAGLRPNILGAGLLKYKSSDPRRKSIFDRACRSDGRGATGPTSPAPAAATDHSRYFGIGYHLGTLAVVWDGQESIEVRLFEGNVYGSYSRRALIDPHRTQEFNILLTPEKTYILQALDRTSGKDLVEHFFRITAEAMVEDIEIYDFRPEKPAIPPAPPDPPSAPTRQLGKMGPRALPPRAPRIPRDRWYLPIDPPTRILGLERSAPVLEPEPPLAPAEIVKGRVENQNKQGVFDLPGHGRVITRGIVILDDKREVLIVITGTKVPSKDRRVRVKLDSPPSSGSKLPLTGVLVEVLPDDNAIRYDRMTGAPISRKTGMPVSDSVETAPPKKPTANSATDISIAGKEEVRNLTGYNGLTKKPLEAALTAIIHDVGAYRVLEEFPINRLQFLLEEALQEIVRRGATDIEKTVKGTRAYKSYLARKG